jgi:hypothetical protein
LSLKCLKLSDKVIYGCIKPLVAGPDEVLRRREEADRTYLRAVIKAGRRTLTPPDPELTGAWYVPGFNPCTCQVKKRFQNLLFIKMQLAPLR